MKLKILASALLAILLGAAPSRPARPNIVWIVSEDNSKHYLKLFDDGGAPAPNIEAMARHGLVFDRAEMLNSILLLRKLQSAGARIFYGHDPAFWQQVPQAPLEIV